MKSLVRLFFALFTLGLTLQPQAQAEVDLFDSDEVLQLTLRSRFDQLREDRHAVEASTLSEKNSNTSLSANIKVMGQSRWHRCSFPMLKINLSDSTPAFHGYRSLYLTTHCEWDGDKNKERAVREYFIYKIYSMLTPMSVRVRLAKIAYIDDDQPSKTLTRYAFFTEPFDQVAARNRAALSESVKLENKPILQVFQFFVHNWDWDYYHNVFRIQNENGIFGIPYDFDGTALFVGFQSYRSGFNIQHERAGLNGYSSRDPLETLRLLYSDSKNSNTEQRASLADLKALIPEYIKLLKSLKPMLSKTYIQTVSDYMLRIEGAIPASR